MNTQLLHRRDLSEINHFLLDLIISQVVFENGLKKDMRKNTGTFFTNRLKTINNILNVISIDESLFNKKILEPACGYGVFLLRLLANIYNKFPDQNVIDNMIKNNLFFVDINPEMVFITKENIKKFYEFLFDSSYKHTFNDFTYDFTRKLSKKTVTLFQETASNHPLRELLGNIDYVIGNPPYVTLYGRRDKKQNEQQRIYYLNNYIQFPSSLKNGKINLVMLFIEHALEFMKQNALLSFIIDISFFESAYLYTRKFLLEKTTIISLDINISDFDVASGQLILKLKKEIADKKHKVQIRNHRNNEITYLRQSSWYNQNDEYKFRLNACNGTDKIISKIESSNDKTLKNMYPKKNLRTCTMLLNLENKFVFMKDDLKKDIKIYPYYQGSKSLKHKYADLEYNRYFYYDKALQDKINDELRIELEKNGIKNKKRIGFGEIVVYENPKIFIRQSAKEIIATYDDKPSSANNSLYVFSLRDNCKKSKDFLKFLCGLLNSTLITFYAQKKNIIRFSNGKQPQIKIADLYSIRIPSNSNLQKEISNLVEKIYANRGMVKEYSQYIDNLVYEYYSISKKEVDFIKKEVKSF